MENPADPSIQNEVEDNDDYDEDYDHDPLLALSRIVPRNAKINRAVVWLSSRKTKNGGRRFSVNAEERTTAWWQEHEDELDDLCMDLADALGEDMNDGTDERFNVHGFRFRLTRQKKNVYVLSAYWQEEEKEENPE